jgi:hypothetical protein
MKLLHTLEQIKYFENLEEQSLTLFKLGTKFNNQELIDLSNKYQNIIQKELDKYNSYIGIECTAPQSYVTNQGGRRSGKIEGKFYFNSYSKSVRCSFRYKSGGFDTHAIAELE